MFKVNVTLLILNKTNFHSLVNTLFMLKLLNLLQWFVQESIWYLPMVTKSKVMVKLLVLELIDVCLTSVSSLSNLFEFKLGQFLLILIKPQVTCMLHGQTIYSNNKDAVSSKIIAYLVITPCKQNSHYNLIQPPSFLV